MGFKKRPLETVSKKRAEELAGKINRTVEVESNLIHKIGYDPDAEIMAIQFKDLSVYAYHQVQPAEFCRFFNAKSLGKHFHEHVKGNYETEKMKGPADHA